MNKAKVFSTLTAITVGAIAASGLVVRPAVAIADDHHAAAGEKSCSGKGEKSCSGKHEGHDCKDGKDKDGHACTEHKGEKSCSGKGEKSCSGNNKH